MLVMRGHEIFYVDVSQEINKIKLQCFIWPLLLVSQGDSLLNYVGHVFKCYEEAEDVGFITNATCAVCSQPLNLNISPLWKSLWLARLTTQHLFHQEHLRLIPCSRRKGAIQSQVFRQQRSSAETFFIFTDLQIFIEWDIRCSFYHHCKNVTVAKLFLIFKHKIIVINVKSGLSSSSFNIYMFTNWTWWVRKSSNRRYTHKNVSTKWMKVTTSQTYFIVLYEQ